MSSRNLAISTLAFGMVFVASSSLFAQMAKLSSGLREPTVGFDQVAPILRKRCQSCHNPEELRGDLSVTDLGALQAGSSSGPVLVAGKPRESLLYTTAAHLDEPTMPPNSRKIPARELEVLRRWIEDGLVAKTGDQPAKQQPANRDSFNKETAEMQANFGQRPTDSQNVPPLPANDGQSSFEPIRPVLRSTPISAFAAQPTDGHTLAIAGLKQIILADLKTQQLLHAIPFPEQEITQLSFTNDGQTIFAAGGTSGLSGSVFGFDLRTGKLKFRVADENDSILALDVSPDTRSIAVGGPSKVVRIYDIDSGKVTHTLRKHTDWILDAKFSPDGLLLASSDRFGGLFVWETNTGELFADLKGHVGAVHSIAWDPNGETLISAGEDAQVRVWNLHHGSQTASWDAGVGPALSLCLSDGKITVAGRAGKVHTFNGPDHLVGSFQSDDQLHRVAFSSSTQQIVAADASGRLQTLDAPKLSLANTLTLPTDASVFAELNLRLAAQKQEYHQKKLLAAADHSRTFQREQLGSGESPRNAPADNTTTSSDVLERLQLEIRAANELAQNQRTTRDQLKEQLSALQRQLDVQNTLVSQSTDHAIRLESLLAELRSRNESTSLSAVEKRQLMKEQLQHQEEIAAEIVKLKSRAIRVAAASTQLSPDVHQNWQQSLSLMQNLEKQLQSQSIDTRRALNLLPEATSDSKSNSFTGNNEIAGDAPSRRVATSNESQ